MALIFCVECRQEVSDKARRCPHCGAPIAASTVSWVPAASGSRRAGGAMRVATVVLFIAVLGAGWWIWQATTSDKKAPFSAGFTAAFREPRKIAEERVALKPGQHVSYAFGLETDSRVNLRITAVTSPVAMMLMSKADAERFRTAGGDLFGGAYSGFPALTSTQVGMLEKTEVVTKGEWTLVVMRPKGGATGTESAPADIALTVY